MTISNHYAVSCRFLLSDATRALRSAIRPGHNRLVDAGWAGVLGATVGALGTGAASLTAALLGRSQARMQVRAEHQRALREPRKAAYITFTEHWWARYNVASQGWIELALAEENRASSEYESLLDAAEAFRDQAMDSADIERAQAVVYVEGPSSVTDASMACIRALTTFVHSLHRAVVTIRQGNSLGGLAEEVEATSATAHEKYLAFLHAASDVLGEDVVQD
ncbi:hypothetical protein ABT142_19540 [Streptomyces sp. NPDC001857]|uniref:hypothetical protein n=1 Tax=unclassified Streptomyces TaxID=2593676 RepID=UPI0033323BE6